ncbi:hypothetical protein VTO42DRAFT_2067 [Malbranchea cinnamomea]
MLLRSGKRTAERDAGDVLGDEIKRILREEPALMSLVEQTPDGTVSSTRARSLMKLSPAASTVKRVAHWICTGTIILSPGNRRVKFDDRFQELAELFVFSEQLRMPNLKHQVIATIMELGRVLGKSDGRAKYPPLRTVKYVYENTRHHCGMRRLLVHYLMQYHHFKREDWGDSMLHERWVQDLRDKLPEFDMDIAIACRWRFVPNLYKLEPWEVNEGGCGFFCPKMR